MGEADRNNAQDPPAGHVYFITHPEIVVEAQVPVPHWRLSQRGLERMRQMLNQPWVRGIARVLSSKERKAMDGAETLAAHLGVEFHSMETLGENDRSATGYLPAAEFEATATAFFANPQDSVRGWERAADAQRRIVAAVDDIVSSRGAAGDIAIIAHGGVGTLLLCHLNGWPIDRVHDQPGAGGGNYFVFDTHGHCLQGWRPIDEIAAG